MSSVCPEEIVNSPRWKASAQILLSFIVELERRGIVKKKVVTHFHDGKPHSESVWVPAYEQKRVEY